MRKRFEPQLRIGSTPISEIRIPTKSRDEFPPYLRALQEIYTNPELSSEIFSLVEKAVCRKSSKTGRPGMNLWNIFVLAGARLCLGANYDRLHYLANSDGLFRKMMGYCDGFGQEEEISYQSIIDNVTLLDDATLMGINDVIVKLGHDVFKKKETEALHIKTDSYVCQSNVHFPTDYNLLWDSARKCLDTIAHLLEIDPSLNGWRKMKDWSTRMKSHMLILSRACASKGKNKEERVKDAATAYLKLAGELSRKIEFFVVTNTFDYLSSDLLIQDLCYFLEMLDKHIDLTNRRLLLKETIPTSDKIYSIFETYTEWITKGKMRPSVELGKRVNIVSDHFHLILAWEIADHKMDVDMLIPLMDRVIWKHQVTSMSADKGYFRKEDKELIELYVPQVIIPKKGKLSGKEKEIERSAQFRSLRNKHSAVESNINELEHCGLERCPDKGYRAFSKYVALGVIAYNLKKIGTKLLEEDRKRLKKAA